MYWFSLAFVLQAVIQGQAKDLCFSVPTLCDNLSTRYDNVESAKYRGDRGYFK